MLPVAGSPHLTHIHEHECTCKRKYTHGAQRDTSHRSARRQARSCLAATCWGASVLGDRVRLHLVRCQKLTLLQNLQHQLFMSGGCTGSLSGEAKARAWHSSAAAQLSRAAPARPSPLAPRSHTHSHRRPARAHVTGASAGQADWWCVALRSPASWDRVSTDTAQGATRARQGTRKGSKEDRWTAGMCRTQSRRYTRQQPCAHGMQRNRAEGTHIGAVAARGRPSFHKELAQPVQGHFFRLRRPLLLLLLLFPLVHHDIAGEPRHLCLVARHLDICRAVARNAFRVRHVAALLQSAEVRTKSPVARAPGARRPCMNGSKVIPPPALTRCVKYEVFFFFERKTLKDAQHRAAVRGTIDLHRRAAVRGTIELRRRAAAHGVRRPWIARCRAVGCACNPRHCKCAEFSLYGPTLPVWQTQRLEHHGAIPGGAPGPLRPAATS